MSIELPALPYALEALEPHISRQTLSVHHGKHHAAYVERARALVQRTEYETATLEEVVRAHADRPGALFNSAAQAWNHAFLWQSMKAGGGGDATGALAKRIEKDFGGHNEFRQQFVKAATEQFGSGWAWLVLDGDNLRIVATSNAGTPLTGSQVPLLTLDVWEHAYYLDYQQRRLDYVTAFLAHLANWDFANANLAKARPGAETQRKRA
ncbi:MAG: Superoxide dismutase [Fe] [Steroidobacteraceae bacterium]|nr:Superoxide dismutase [Fe] [Steroidobacteraceae bacterium]